VYWRLVGEGGEMLIVAVVSGGAGGVALICET
jgi:hypothetical protein